MMLTCSSCALDLPTHDFSNSQRKKGSAARCRSCVEQPPSSAAPPSAAEARSKTACWGCSIEPSEGATFKRCAKCAEEKLTTCAVYCSIECHENHWAVHKQWHAAQRSITKNRQAAIEQDSSLAAREKELEARFAVRASQDEVYDLLAQAHSHTAKGNLKKAMKLCRKAIDLRPENADAHHNLGWNYQLSNDFVQAASCYVKATELTPERGSAWAHSISSADNALCHESCVCVPKPVWFDDRVWRLQLAQMAYEWDPSFGNTSNMLGNALSKMGRRDEAKWYWHRSDMMSNGHDVTELHPPGECCHCKCET